MMYETPEFPQETPRELQAPAKSRGEATVPTGVGPGGHNPLFEPSPNDSGYGVGSTASGGGIGIARRDVPEAHLRKVRAGGLLTKLPFSAPTAKPRIRFFRVTRAMTELQWGDPKDAAAPALDSKLPLHEVQTVVHGHATKTFEKHRKRVGPPSHCFSLVCLGRTLDLVAGTADDADMWSAALDVLAGRAREARAIADADAAARSAGNAVTAVSPSRNGADPSPSPSPSPSPTAVRPGLLARPRAPVPTDAPGFSRGFSPSGGIGNASSTPTPDAPERRRAGGFGFGAFGGGAGTKPGTKPGTNAGTNAGTVASRAAPAVFTPAPAGSLSRQNSLEAERRERLRDYADGGGSRPWSDAGANAAMQFVPVASRPPVSPAEGHVAVSFDHPGDAPSSGRGRGPGRDGDSPRDRGRRAGAGVPSLSLGSIGRFANRGDGAELLRDGAHATVPEPEPESRARLTSRTYESGGGELLVEAFSRARHGRVKELDALFARGVDPAARDSNGLTLLHMAAQNNQRKTAKLVLKRTDFASDPPRLSLIDAQTNQGQTPLHFCFAYGYRDLGRYLLSLGADDAVANVHGMTCYEGLDPDEPPRETLNDPEIVALARRKREERRAESLRPGTTGPAASFNRPSPSPTPRGAPSPTATSPRDPYAPSAGAGAYPYSHTGHTGHQHQHTGPHGYPHAGAAGGWDPSGSHASPRGSSPHHPYAPPYGSPQLQFPNPYGPYHAPHPYPYPHPHPHPHAHANPYAAMSPFGGGGYPGMDPTALAMQAMAAQQAAALAAMTGAAGQMAGGDVGNIGGNVGGVGGVGGMGSMGAVVGAMGSVGAAGAMGSVGSSGVGTPKSRSGSGGGEEAAWRRATAKAGARSDSSDLDSSDEDARAGATSRGAKPSVARAGSGSGAAGGSTRFAPSSSADRDRARRRARRMVGSDRAAAAMPARRGGGTALSRAARDAELDRRAAVRAAAMRGTGFHSSDSDDLTSASEGETPPATRTVAAATRARGVPRRARSIDDATGGEVGGEVGGARGDRGGEKGEEAGTIAGVSKLSLGAGSGAGEETFAALAAEKNAAAARRADRRERRAREREGMVPGKSGAEPKTGIGTSGSTSNASSPRAGSAPGPASEPAPGSAPSVGSDPSSAGRSVLPARLAAKVTSTLRSLGDASAESIRVALSTGEVSPDDAASADSNAAPGPVRISAETIRIAREILPTAADLAAIRATYGKGGADPSRASVADRFFLEMSRVPRAAAKADALVLRAYFSRDLAETREALVAARDAATQAAQSPRLARLLDVVVALRDVLSRDAKASPGTASASASSPGSSAWKIAAAMELTESARARTRPSDGDRGTLLHHLARTVAAKSPSLLDFAEDAPALAAAAAGASLARLDAVVSRLDAATKATARELEACADPGAHDTDAAFARSFGDFADDAARGVAEARALSREAAAAAAKLMAKFGPAPEGATSEGVLRALADFAEAFGRAARENAEAEGGGTEGGEA